MAETSVEKSPYSFHFKMLRVLGFWFPESSNPSIKCAYLMLNTFMLLLGFVACALMIVKFSIVLGDSRKFTWSLLITTLFTGWWVKYMYMLHRSAVLKRMRLGLHRKAMSRITPEDENLNKLSVREMRKIESMFYSALVIFIPLWLISWYFGLMWGERDIPVPVWIPFEVDFKDELQFHVMFTLVSVIGALGLLFMVTIDMVMFTFLVQISREYERLIMDFTKIRELFECEIPVGENVKKSSREMNPWLRDIKVKKLLKELCIRHQELIQEYILLGPRLFNFGVTALTAAPQVFKATFLCFRHTTDFEFSYNFSMFLHFFLTSGMFVFCTMLVLLAERPISFDMIYIAGFLSVLFVEISLFCWYATQIRGQCFRVGEEAYSVMWYRMGTDIQKNISMIILRSQHPPKITSGKIIEMDLHALVILVRNIYSFLTLFKKIAVNSNE